MYVYVCGVYTHVYCMCGACVALCMCACGVYMYVVCGVCMAHSVYVYMYCVCSMCICVCHMYKCLGCVYVCIGEGNGTPLQYSCLENPMGGGAWWAAVHGVARSPTRLSDFTFTFHFHALEKEMATHSRVLAWRIPGTGEPGGLPSMGSHRVGHD